MEVPRIGSSYESHTKKQKCFFFTKVKAYLTEKITSFLKKMKTTNKNI